MISNSSTKSARCTGRMRASADLRPASFVAQIISRMARMRSASKNMCSGAAKADALSAKGARLASILRRVGVGAHGQSTRRVRPGDQAREVAGELRLAHGDFADVDASSCAVDGDDVARLQHALADAQRLRPAR